MRGLDLGSDYILGSGSCEEKIMDPDSVFSGRLDPNPDNIRPDAKPCLQLFFQARKAELKLKAAKKQQQQESNNSIE